MPELPEVEITKEGLKDILNSQVFIEKIVFRRKNLRSPLPSKKTAFVTKRNIQSVFRRAKYIFIATNEHYIISHLGMTGAWRIEDSLKELKLHDHVILCLNTKKFLIYNDPRRFGVFDIISKNELQSDKRFLDLGPEPLTDDFNPESFFSKSKNKNVCVKQFLMDQKNVVGVGNIYASEALFASGISPLLAVNSLSKAQVERLIESIKVVLKSSIQAGGSSISDYKAVDEKKGSFQEQHYVYGRQQQPCRKCSHPIKLEVICGRSTFWCVKCQKTSRKKAVQNDKKYPSRKNIPQATRT